MRDIYFTRNQYSFQADQHVIPSIYYEIIPVKCHIMEISCVHKIPSFLNKTHRHLLIIFLEMNIKRCADSNQQTTANVEADDITAYRENPFDLTAQ